MLRAAFDLQLEIVTYFLNGARLAKSPTSLASMFHPGPYGCYETRDGWLVLSMSPLKALRDALDLPALAPYATVAHNFPAREEIARIVEPVMRGRTTQEWIDFLVPRGVWVAPIRTHEEAFADPAVQAADAVEEIDHPVAGRVRLLRFPVELSSGRATVSRPPPDARGARRGDPAGARIPGRGGAASPRPAGHLSGREGADMDATVSTAASVAPRRGRR